MTPIHIQLLGDFCLTVNGKSVTKLDTPRLRALLAYLALHHHVPQTRHHLAFLFWPDSSESQALTNLRKQLLYLRNTLPEADTLLQIERQTVQWQPTVPFALDVAEFEVTLARSAAMVGEPAIDLLRSAVDLYRGDLLPECYDEWVFPKREALREQYAGALTRLIRLLEEQRDYLIAIPYAQRLLRHDPLHEPTYRCLMRLHALNGDRPTALRIYHTCVTQLREELGVDPDDETQHSYELLLHGEAQVAQPSALAANAPFVGRQPEWQQLQQRWRMAISGQPYFVLIAGEAGIGKTRLAEELLSWAIHQGICVSRARCYAAEGRLTYAPVLDWLRSEVLHAHRAKVEPAWLSELARLLPELLREFPNLPPPPPMTQSWQRRQLFEAMARTVLAANQPLLLLLDDLQWCDQETLEWLHFLLRITDNPAWSAHGQVRLLVVGTARFPDEVEATHPLQALLNQLRSGERLTQMDLARLSQTETSTLAQQMASGELTSQSLQQLYTDTAGNPLFIVETIRATQENLPRNNSTSQLSLAPTVALTDGEVVAHVLPPKVFATLQARLGQLSATARELCEWAAIVGQSFTLDLLVLASKMADDRAVAALDELWQRRIIREHGADAYDFSHDRLRDVVVMSISRIRQRYLHRAIAEALESQNVTELDSVAAQIAVHFDAAGVVEKAIHYYTQAAARARRVYANHETVSLLQRALQLLTMLPENNARNQRELTLLNAIIPSLSALTGYTMVNLREVLERTYALSQQLGVSPNPAFIRTLAIYKVGVRTFEEVQAMGTQLLERAQQADDPVLFVEGWYVLGVNAFWHGKFMQSKTHLQRSIANYSADRHERHIVEYGVDPGVYCRTRLGLTLWYLGFPDQARQQCATAVALARELRHLYTLNLALAFMVWLNCECRDSHAAAINMHLRDTELSTISPQTRNVFQFLSGWHLLQCGEIKASIAQLSEYTVLGQMSRADSVYRAHTFALLAEAYRLAGNYEQAFVALAEGFAFHGDSQESWYIAEFYRLKGELFAGQGGQLAEAEACFQQALTIARGQEAKSLELRAAMSLARLWVRQGKKGEAHALLAEVYDWFTEGFDTVDLIEAKALLEQLA